MPCKYAHNHEQQNHRQSEPLQVQQHIHLWLGACCAMQTCTHHSAVTRQSKWAVACTVATLKQCHATDNVFHVLWFYMQMCCMATGWYQLWSKCSTAFFFLWRSVRMKYWRTGRAPEGKLANTLAKVATSGVGMVASEISTECLGTPEPTKNWHLADFHQDEDSLIKSA